MLYEKKADEDGHLFFSVYEKGCLRPYPELPHFHNSIEIFFVKDGEYSVYIGGEGRLLKSGECAFVDSLLTDRDLTSIAEDGETLMKILDAIYESARLGKEVAII